MRTMLKSKIHRARVTDGNIAYEGSITIDKKLSCVRAKRLHSRGGGSLTSSASSAYVRPSKPRNGSTGERTRASASGAGRAPACPSIAAAAAAAHSTVTGPSPATPTGEDAADQGPAVAVDRSLDLVVEGLLDREHPFLVLPVECPPLGAEEGEAAGSFRDRIRTRSSRCCCSASIRSVAVRNGSVIGSVQTAKTCRRAPISSPARAKMSGGSAVRLPTASRSPATTSCSPSSTAE